jgi:membrane protease YdiL (CAAX protease family)
MRSSRKPCRLISDWIHPASWKPWTARIYALVLPSAAFLVPAALIAADGSATSPSSTSELVTRSVLWVTAALVMRMWTIDFMSRFKERKREAISVPSMVSPESIAALGPEVVVVLYSVANQKADPQTSSLIVNALALIPNCLESAPSFQKALDSLKTDYPAWETPLADMSHLAKLITLLAKKEKRPRKDSVGDQKPMGAAGFLAGAGALALNMASNLILTYGFKIHLPVQNVGFVPSSGWDILLLTIIAVAAAQVEERIFRGSVMGGLSRRMRWPMANLLQAVAFMSVHFIGWILPFSIPGVGVTSPLLAPNLVAAGLFYGYIAHRYGLSTSVRAHQLNNGIAVLSRVSPWIAIIAPPAVTVIGLWLSRREKKPGPPETPIQGLTHSEQRRPEIPNSSIQRLSLFSA